MPLTPADVRNKQFTTTRLRPGYAEGEVDAFLDEVEDELDRLIQENGQLRGKLAECLRGGTPAALSAPLADPGPEMLARSPRVPEPELAASPAGTTSVPAEDGADTAVRVLMLAQQVADQATADAWREAGETLSHARQEADELLSKARQQAEQVTGDARARAESVERDAQERHRQVMGSLTEQRETLERDIDDLRVFEREFRSRLTAQVEGLLRDLEAGADGEETCEHQLPASASSVTPP
jgi:DivIVA domain-containing protein